MKLLGTYISDEANEYMDCFEKQGLEVEAEDVYAEYLSMRGIRMTRMDVKLFVAEENYDRAIGMIKDLKTQQEIRVQGAIGQSADGVMLKIALGVIILSGLAVYLGITQGWF